MKTNLIPSAGKNLRVSWHTLFTLTLALFVAAGAIPSLRAANVNWNGSGADANWNTALNWVGGVAPVANDSLFFDGASNTAAANNIAASIAFNGITLNTSAGTCYNALARGLLSLKKGSSGVIKMLQLFCPRSSSG